MATTYRAAGSRAEFTAVDARRTQTARRDRGVGRKVLEICALVVIAALLVCAPLISRSRAQSFETGTVLVEQGDTLWTIAREHPVPGLSTAQAVEVIAQINALESAQIPAGMAVRVPSSQEKVAFALK